MSDSLHTSFGQDALRLMLNSAIRRHDDNWLKRGTQVEKVLSDPKDITPDGERGILIAAVNLEEMPIPEEADGETHGCFVFWDKHLSVGFIMGSKVRPL